MANIDSDLYTLEVAAAADTSQAPNAHAYGGAVFIKEAKVTLTGATADGDLLRICHLPPGARIIPALSKAQCSADPGGTLILNIGTSADIDAFARDINLSAGGAFAFDGGAVANPPLQAVTPGRLTARSLVYATIPTSGASTVTNGTTLTFWIAYTL